MKLFNHLILLINSANKLVVCLCFLFIGISIVSAQNSTAEFIKDNDTIVVYKDVPGYNSVPERKLMSDKYSIRIRSAATNNEWVDVFANYTYNRSSEFVPQILDNGGEINYHYQTFTDQWSHTYGNIEMSRNTAVEVEISFINGFTIKGQPIVKAAAHPSQKVSSQPVVTNGKIYFTINKPGQITIDINGQMDDHHAAINPMPPVNGVKVPVHSISFYANPVMKKPSLADPNVLIVEPGVKPPTDLGAKTIMYFKPGVHDLGINFKIFPNKKYYIPGDAVVIGTLNNYAGVAQGIVRAGENIKIFGYGTISNWGIHHPYYIVPQGVYAENEHCPIFITDAMHVEVNGITISDPCFHSLKLQSWGQRPNKKSIETVCKWVKIVSWRSNGDGIGSAELVEDSFIRTGDDASYIKGDRLRITFWRDVHAAVFHMAGIPGSNDSAPLRIEDCDVIYNRSRDVVFKDNGAVFQQRGEGVVGQHTVDLKIRDFRNHDKRANSQVFSLKSKVVKSSGTSIGSSYTGIVFENVSIEAESALTSVKQALVGCIEAPWDGGITFDNVTFKGVLLTEANFANYFNFDGVYPNDFAKNIIFKNSINYTLSLAADTHGRISSNPGVEKYTAGTNVILTAIPNPGYEFAGWSGDATGITNPITIVMDSNKSVSAIFQKASTFVFSTAGSGSWTVPDGVTSVILKSWGGGGAGGSTFNDAMSTGNLRGGGGAGGSYASKTIAVTPGDVIDFTVGKGGDGSPQGFTHLSDAEAGGNTFASINNQQVVKAVGGPGGKNIFINSGANGTGGVVSNTGNEGDVVRLGGNGGNAGGVTPNVGSGCGGGSAGADGAGGAGQTLAIVGVAGAGGGAAGGAGTNSTTINPLKGGIPGGGGAGSTIRINAVANTYKVGAGGGTGKLVITINNNLSVSDIDLMPYKYVYVYPNPVAHILNIDFPNGGSKRAIKIVNLLGQLIYSAETEKSNLQIDMKSLNVKGVVVIQVSGVDGVSNHKVIVQ